MDGTTLRDFVTAIIDERPWRVGLSSPRLTVEQHRSIVRAAQAHGLGDVHPADICKAEGFRLWRANLPQRCGACRGDDIYIPVLTAEDHEALLIHHERMHGWVYRKQSEGNEADAWWLTLAVAGESTLVPEWFRQLSENSIAFAI